MADADRHPMLGYRARARRTNRRIATATYPREMTASVDVTSASRIWLKVAYDGISAEPGPLPGVAVRLLMSSTGDGVDVGLHRPGST